MALVCKYSVHRFVRHSYFEIRLLNGKLSKVVQNERARFCSTGAKSKSKSIFQSNLGLIATGLSAGVVLGGSYSWYTRQDPTTVIMEDLQRNEVVEIEHTILPSKPDVPISRFIQVQNDKTDLKLTLFQYPTCPFCCKVRAFLDYYGISYEVVEVDPVLRQQTSWTTYKKVPILLVKTDEGYQQLNDSTMIISALTSLLNDEKLKLKDITQFYPMIEFKENGILKTDVLNRYFLMFQNNVPKGKAYESAKVERDWRKWADDVLVHTLSPNVYRTLKEALQAFTWFSEVGEWEKLFPAWERMIIVYVGASAMWMIGKRLRKRHGLKVDVRESLYDECRKWMNTLSKQGTTFLGGDKPNLGDLAVYGVLSSIEGCEAFSDALKTTNIGTWYYPMKERVMKHEGRPESIIADLHNIK